MNKRIALGIACILVLFLVYLFQGVNFFSYILDFIPEDVNSVHPYTYFIFNKTLRLLVNDLACLFLIKAIFQEKKYSTLATYLLLLELFILLPTYFIIKLSLEGVSEISSPLLSQIHRLIVNPLLMILLMISFFYQRSKAA